MKIVVIGGSGLIGRKLVGRLQGPGHQVLAASPNSGVNTITRDGLAEALIDANVVVDVSNSPSFEDKAVLEFFDRSSRNLLAAAAVAGVSHYVALSVVGLERLPDSGYLRAKLVQENLIKGSGIPYSILRATQFFEFVGSIVEAGAAGDSIHVSSAELQPIASDDVVVALAALAVGAPLNGTTEVAGPERIRLDVLGRRLLSARGDCRVVIGDPATRYFGAVLDDNALTAGKDASIGAITFGDWLTREAPKAV